MILPLLAVSLVAGGSAQASSSRDELRFGVEVARMGLWQEALFRYEKALKLKPGSVYIQQNYDLFREADEKRNRKAKKKP